MSDQRDLFKDGAELVKPPQKKTSGLHMDKELYDRAEALGKKEGMSTNAVLVQLIKIGLSAIEGQRNTGE